MSEEHGDLVEPPDVEMQDYVLKFLPQWGAPVTQGVQEDCGRKCRFILKLISLKLPYENFMTHRLKNTVPIFESPIDV